jgi:hypothetical protein
MKRILACIPLLFLFSFTVSGQEVQYSFSQDRPLSYAFRMEGDIAYYFEGMPGQEFKVLSKGNITLETVEVAEDFYRVKLTPSKTLMELNSMVLEDITAQDTARSQMISTVMMDIKRNGEIVNAEEISPGILNLSQILMILPVFPEKTYQGRKWEQTVPAFSLPGIPLCDLKFTYFYAKESENAVKIDLLSNHRIREKRSDGGRDIEFTGLNSSKGGFSFDKKSGGITDFKGVINLVLKAVYRMPPEPGQKTSRQMPLNMKIKLNVNLSPADKTD